MASPVKKGYVFQGWLNGDTDQIWDMEAPVIGDLNLVAQFAPIRYQVVLDGNGADNPQAMEGVSVDAVYDQKGALPQNLFTKEYHTFVGWSREENGEAQFHDQAEIFNLTDIFGGNRSLICVWKRETARWFCMTDPEPPMKSRWGRASSSGERPADRPGISV